MVQSSWFRDAARGVERGAEGGAHFLFLSLGRAVPLVGGIIPLVNGPARWGVPKELAVVVFSADERYLPETAGGRR